MRGKAVSSQQWTVRHRITPAYAGKSFIVYPESAPEKDHPRLCGEKYAWIGGHYAILGSPPPMRGKAVETTGHTQPKRITPAYAGKR